MKLRLIALLSTAALVFSSGCAALQPPAAEPPAPAPGVSALEPKSLAELSVPWFVEDSLNPYRCETLQNYYLAGLLCDPLVALSPQQQPENRLALEITQNGLSYVVRLRGDARFPDGVPLTAEDVLYSLELARGSVRFSAGLAAVEKAEAPDSSTVILTLTAPDVFFARSLTFPILKSGTGEDAVPMGVGRFLPMLSENLLVRNDAYYNPVKRVEHLSLEPTDSLEEQSFAIMEGRLDLMYSDLQEDLNLGLGIGYRQVPLSNLLFLGVNSRSPAGELPVRQALSGLIDRDELVRKVYLGFATATSLPVSPSAATSLNASDLEVNKAGQYLLLEQAGYTLSDTGKRTRRGKTLTLELLVNEESAERVAAAELLTRMYAEAGIDLTVVKLPFPLYSERVAKGEYDLYIGEVRLAYNMDISSLIFPGGALSPAAPEVPGLRALYTEVRTGTAEPKELEKQLRAGLPVVPLLFRRGILCFSRDFSANIVATEQDIFYNITDW